MKFPDPLLDTDCNAIAMSSLAAIETWCRSLAPAGYLDGHLDLSVVVAGDPSPNGFARLSTGYEIAVNLGFVLWARQIASNVVCEIRHGAGYRPVGHDFSAQKYADCPSGFEAVQLMHRHRSPLPPEWRYEQFNFASTMVRVVWLHEIAHVIRGHLALLRAKFKRREITLWDDYASYPYPDHDFVRALEYDADRWAGFLAADLAYDPPGCFPEMAGGEPERLLALMVSCFAIVCGYRQHRDRQSGLSQPDYPRPLARLAIFMTGIQGFLQRAKPDVSVSRIMGDGMDLAMVSSEVFPELRSLYDFTRASNNRDLTAHGACVVRHFARYADELDAYTLIGR